MSILTRLLGPRSTASADALERVLRGAYGVVTRSGAAVSPDSAMRVATVYACVRVLAEDIAAMPLILYRRTKDGGKERAIEHPLYRIMRQRWNRRHTAFEGKEFAQGCLGLRGNAYALINRAGGVVRELIPIRPDRVTVIDNGDLTARYKVAGAADEYTDREILHLRGLSTDGFMGLGPIAVGRESIGLAMAMQDHGAALFRNGARPGGVLQHPEKISKEAAERLKASVEDAVSGENLGRLLLLEEGVTWAKVGIDPKDGQFLESRKFQRSEIAAFFRMPLHKIGDLERATFSNIEHQSLEYVTGTLLSWMIRWEQRCNESLLTEREQDEYFFEHLVDALLRGDTKSRYEAYRMAILDGWMNRNEVRQRENLNPKPGLDEFYEPSNVTTTSDRNRNDDPNSPPRRP